MLVITVEQFSFVPFLFLLCFVCQNFKAPALKCIFFLEVQILSLQLVNRRGLWGVNVRKVWHWCPVDKPVES